MEDKIKLIEALKDIVEIARTQNNEITMDEINEYTKNLSLNDENKEHVLEYLISNQLKIKGYTMIPKNKLKYLDEQIEKVATFDEDNRSENNIELENTKESSESVQEEAYLNMYLAELDYIKPCLAKEEVELIEKLLDKDITAKNRLIEIYLKEVVKLAKNYQGQGILMADLIQEGNIGLIYAIDSYEAEKDKVDFKKHIVTCINSTIEAAIDELISAKTFDKKVIAKVGYIREKLMAYMTDIGRKPTIEEAAQFLELPLDEVQDIIRLLKEDDVPIR